jgi:hypothetical protein
MTGLLDKARRYLDSYAWRQVRESEKVPGELFESHRTATEPSVTLEEAVEQALSL